MKTIITGGTKGIGRAIAEAFAKEGYDLAICSRNESDLIEMKMEFSKKHPKINLLTKVVDVSLSSEVASFAEYIATKWNQVDVLVNNAGIFIPGEIHKEKEGVLETMMQTNLYSAYHLTRAILPLMLPFRKGHIFNMCSVASVLAYPNGGAYSISKFALLGFSQVLREEMKDKGIKVTSILPGATWSNSWAGVDIPESRLMQAEDIAKTVLGAYHLSDSAVVEEIILRPQLGDL